MVLLQELEAHCFLLLLDRHRDAFSRRYQWRIDGRRRTHSGFHGGDVEFLIGIVECAVFDLGGGVEVEGCARVSLVHLRILIINYKCVLDLKLTSRLTPGPITTNVPF